MNNINILIIGTIIILIYEFIMIYNNIDKIIYIIAIIGQILLLYGIYFDISIICHISHCLYFIIMIMLIIFSYNKISLFFVNLMLILTMYFRAKMNMCPFKDFDKESYIDDIDSDNFILIVSILTIIKLIYLTYNS